MMAEVLNINKDSRVMDLATGSAGFLISAMEIMRADAELHGAKVVLPPKKKSEQ
ncbi:N-6 DNA methylase [Escherichia coli]